MRLIGKTLIDSGLRRARAVHSFVLDGVRQVLVVTFDLEATSDVKSDPRRPGCRAVSSSYLELLSRLLGTRGGYSRKLELNHCASLVTGR